MEITVVSKITHLLTAPACTFQVCSYIDKWLIIAIISCMPLFFSVLKIILAIHVKHACIFKFIYLLIKDFTTLEYVHVHKCYSLLIKIV